MQLTKIRIKNYRLLIDAELEVDPKTTLIGQKQHSQNILFFVHWKCAGWRNCIVR